MNEPDRRPPLPFLHSQCDQELERERSSDADSSTSLSDDTTNGSREHILITQIYATDVMSGLRRTPAGFYVAVEIDGKTSKTSVRSTVGEDVVEWYEEILLPSETSTVVFFKIYASFKPGEKSGGGVLLRRFKSTVGDLLVLKEGLHPIMFLDQKLLLPRRPLKIVIERRTFHVEASLATLDPLRDSVNQRLEQVTDIGNCALLRYRQLRSQRDLREAITHFEYAEDICSPDHSRHSNVLFNLATAKFVHCQDNNHYLDFDIPLTMFQNALHLSTNNHPARRMTALGLCFALLDRLWSQSDTEEKMNTKGLLSGVVKSYAYQVAWVALQMAGIFVSSVAMKSDASHPRHMNSDDEEFARWMLAMLPDISDQDPYKRAMLADLGIFLYRRFDANGDLADIDESISMLENAVRLTPDGHPSKPAWLKDLADSIMARFARVGHLPDLHRSISVNEEAVRLTLSGGPEKPARLNALGILLSLRFELLGNQADINKSISIFEKAVHLTSDSHIRRPTASDSLGNSVRATISAHLDKAGWLKNLGDSLMTRFEHLGDLADLHRGISAFEEAVFLTPNDHPEKPACLDSLGISISRRFMHLGRPADMNLSVSNFEEAVHLTPNRDHRKGARLNNLGVSLSGRFEQLGDRADVTRSITMNEEAVRLTPNGHPDRPTHLNGLGKSYLCSFRCSGDLKDINMSISLFEEAVQVTPDDDPKKPMWLNNLGISLSSRFGYLGEPVDLSRSISMIEESVRLTPDSHPSKPDRLHSLGNSLSSRFECLGDVADINRSIMICREALRIIPSGHPDKSAWMSDLGMSLCRRFQHLDDISDINESISVMEEAVNLAPNVYLKPGGLMGLGISLSRSFERLGDLMDMNRSILVNEEAVRLTSNDHPDKPARLICLGGSLSNRFDCLGDLADIDKSISILKEAVLLTPDGHADKPHSLRNLGMSLYRRFERLGDREDIQNSVSIMEEAVRLTPIGHPDRPGLLNSLGISLQYRFRSLGELADIHKSISTIEEAVRLSPVGHPSKTVLLSTLGGMLIRRFEHLGDPEDIHRSISLTQEAIRLAPDNHHLKPTFSSNLGTAFMHNFDNSGDPTHRTAAISHYSVASRASTGPVSSRFIAARCWINALHLEGNSHDILEAYTTAIDILPQLAWLGFSVAERHRLLRQAADVARDAAAIALKVGTPEKAVECLEQGRSVVWSQFLHLRTPVDELRTEHRALADQFQQISQQLEHAGSSENATSIRAVGDLAAKSRSLEDEVQRHHDLAIRREKLLNEIRSLPGFDQFLLPKKIDQLASLAHSGPIVYLNASEHGCDALIVTTESRGVVPVPLPRIDFDELLLLRTLLRLLLERDRLIITRDDISALVPSKNNSASRQFYDTLLECQVEGGDRAVKAKQQRIGGYTPDDLFLRILARLWNRVVKPVAEALGLSAPQSDMEKMPHIYWCPTGPFAFLPIHAAGLYDTAEVGTKLSDFAISSYIPTLSALAPSDQTSLNVSLSGNIHIVAVPQPATDGLSGLVCVEEEINHIKTLSNKTPHAILQESDSTIEDVMERMKDADWVHFACHGVQDPHNPLDSGLCLADGRRLKLSDIIRLSRPQGGLAFLSACQTAQGDEKFSEESVHLAAGMLLAGYGGVIATMWAIRDPDAPKVTKDVYEYLFRDGKIPDCADASVALHCAVQQLRNSGASFTSWVPFVHFGR